MPVVGTSEDFGDAMNPAEQSSYDYYSHDFNRTKPHIEYSNYYYYSFSSYFYQFDLGLDHDDREVLYIVAFVFLLVLLPFGLVTNIAQLYGIVGFPRIRQDVQHIFIANINIVDILALVVIGLANLCVCGLEVFGDVLSHAQHAQGARVYLEIFLQIMHTSVVFHLASMITALAFDQYFIVAYPVLARDWRTPRTAFITCIILWIVGIVVALADGLTFVNIFDFSVPGQIDTVMLIKDSLIFILLYIVPTILTIAFTMMTCRVLRSARTGTPSADNNHANNAQRFTQLEENGNVPGALARAQDLPNNIALIASFIIFWTLYHVIHLMIAFIWSLKQFGHWIFFNNNDEIMIVVADLAAFFNIALNPLFYVICNTKFRQHLSRVLYALFRPGTRSYSGHIDDTTSE